MLAINSFFLLVGQACYLIGQWCIFAIIANYGSPGELGEYALALAFVTPVLVVLQFQLRQAVVTDIAAEFDYRSYELLRVIAMLFAVGTCIVMAIVLRAQVDPYVLILIAGWKALDSVSDIYQAKHQARGNVRQSAVMLAMQAILPVSGFAAIFLLRKSIAEALVAATLLAGVMAFFNRLADGGKYASNLSPKDLQRIFMRLWLLGVAAGLVALSANIPRYILGQVVGLEAVAVFAVAASLTSAITLLQGAVSQAVLRRLSEVYSEDGRRNFKNITSKLTTFYLIVVFAFGCVFYFFGRDILSFMFSAAYVKAWPVLLLLTVSLAIGAIGVTGSFALQAGRKFSWQTYHVVLALVVQLGLCLVLIPQFGVIGAAIAEVCKQIVSVLVLTFLWRSFLHGNNGRANS